MICLAAEGANAESLSAYRLNLGQGLAGTTAVAGELRTTAHPSIGPGVLAETERAVRLRVRSAVCAPLRAGEDVFGVLEALNAPQSGGFNERDTQLLTTIADQAAAAMELASRLERMRHAFMKTVEHLTDLLGAPEGSAQSHPRRALPLADALVKRLALADETARVVELTNILHDVGAGSVGQELPLEPRELTEGERDELRSHAAMGALLLQPLESTWMHGVVGAVRHHHEWLDGQGYPDRLTGDHIPVAARITAVVQAYLAMTEGRPYRGSKTPQEALAELRIAAGTQFDPQVVEALADHLGEVAGT
jgi:HD-GYP domain-containing protein (c-di-GMP phosphodiesterase class II)